MSDRAALESWIAELVNVLTDARNAIASLPMETLGYASDPMGQQIHWPIRDELLHRIDTAMHHGLSDVGSLPPRAPSSQPAESAGAKTGGGK